MKKKKKLLVAGIALSVLFSTNLQAQTVNYTGYLIFNEMRSLFPFS